MGFWGSSGGGGPAGTGEDRGCRVGSVGEGGVSLGKRRCSASFLISFPNFASTLAFLRPHVPPRSILKTEIAGTFSAFMPWNKLKCVEDLRLLLGGTCARAKVSGDGEVAVTEDPSIEVAK